MFGVENAHHFNGSFFATQPDILHLYSMLPLCPLDTAWAMTPKRKRGGEAGHGRAGSVAMI